MFKGRKREILGGNKTEKLGKPLTQIPNKQVKQTIIQPQPRPRRKQGGCGCGGTPPKPTRPNRPNK
ncbi:hypothetical protein [Marininema halotolerans]|uniref:Uncharacterized protein n=1 Tax=Marininema halotolerans TaxID=1155944 RepID=A0A1I6R952_9BACL|nr:hypothetical protein [Marininema halotolerans]SFS61186.1 hypothetical protein SAMN05444972_104282 [Marininema halotolerans]